jgi:hypothetical protein
MDLGLGDFGLNVLQGYVCGCSGIAFGGDNPMAFNFLG